MENKSQECLLITGGTGVIGKELVKHFLKRDYQVLMSTRNKEGLASFVKENNLSAFEHSLYAIELDFFSKASIANFIMQIEMQGFFPSVIVHNARSLDTLKIDSDGTSKHEDLVKEYEAAVAVPYKLSMELIKSKSGNQLKNIIFISSIYGIVAPTPSLYENFTMSSPIQYGLAKSAQIHLTKELSVRLAKYNIRVNCVSYGGIKGRANESFEKRYSQFVPQKRMIGKSEVVGPIDFLVSENSIGMTGHNLIYDGGWTVW